MSTPLPEAPEQVVGTGLPSPSAVHPVKYRGDIDGLRAIAVGAVILYHMFPSRLPAGGIGVDIFFVISGYLVGGIVIASVAANRFSFRDFYLRRIRRILPAFLVMVMCTSVLAAVPLYPWELTSFAKSGLSAIFGISNIFFYYSADYFAAQSSTFPLLHTWSLGIEEQFYLFLPIIILALAGKMKKWIFRFLLLTIFISILFSAFELQSNPIGAFYLLPSRWWELAIGAVATQTPKRWLSQPSICLAVSMAGVALMVGSLILVQPEHGFPGPVLLPACIGTALFLVSGSVRLTMVHRLMAVTPARYAGLASYSLYLWHWPIIVLYKQFYLTERIGPSAALPILLLTTLLGFGSWYFIERPFRSKMSPTQLLIRTGGLFALSGSLLSVIIINHGFPDRFSAETLRLASITGRTGQFAAPPYHCFLPVSDSLAQYDHRCLGSVSGKSNWLLVGDSHAAMLWNGLADNLPKINIQSAVVFGCEINLTLKADGQLCNNLMHKAMVEHVNERPPAVLVLTSRWLIVDKTGISNLNSRLSKKGVRLLIIGPTPEYTIPVPRLMAESIRRNDPNLIDENISQRIWQTDSELKKLSTATGFSYISALKYMCNLQKKCTVADKNGNLLYFDQNHLNKTGANYLVRRIISQEAIMKTAAY
ncbi:acyltransferase family protein [Sphingomonas sp. SORGH_AS_0438]|uniref:acyltransferase family protein n=1 Tax=Sphingomonas sp. SORGH_AS_0438 TaxID=3041756 RepID=UPI0028547D24|nr:acyltransferase family protein [Sphingomonas sp. SORGH_AS_0438]MDR6126058.1 peptidoglycan/LPS O-acetylase OafA/YrhL [Sphingomonas sp. SORGH_AS_0438]